jgi:very-short-patch-repair endonuclease
MIGLVAEHILAFSKNQDTYKKLGVGKIDVTGEFSNPDNDARGNWASKPWKVGSNQTGSRYQITSPTGRVFDEEWMGDETTYKELFKDKRIIFPKNGGGLPRKKYFRYEREEEGQCATNWWHHSEFGHNQGANDEMTSLFGVKNVFDNPKPKEVARGLIQISNVKSSDIILDFFAGSGTTAQAVLELNKEDGGNRKFILVQMPEPCDEDSEAFKAGYKTIADIAKERIRRVIRKLTSPLAPLLEGRGARGEVEKGARGERGAYTEELFKGAGPTLFEKARSLRKETTEAEEKLWQVLRNRAFDGYKFRRQHPIGKYIADFYCHENKLVVEVDGGCHNEAEQKKYDAARTQAINEFGVRVIRFTNDEILNSLPEVLKKISEAMHSPSPQGEGWGEVGFKVFKLSPSNFKIWRGAEIDSEEKLTEQLNAFTNPIKPGSEKQNMLYELMLKAGYELTSPLTPLQMERGTETPSPQGEGWGEVYSINNNELIIALDAMNEKLIEQIIAAKPQKVITLDNLFTGNDQLKTNTVLQMKDAGVEFKTV